MMLLQTRNLKMRNESLGRLLTSENKERNEMIHDEPGRIIWMRWRRARSLDGRPQRRLEVTTALTWIWHREGFTH